MGSLFKVFKVHAKINQQTTNFHQGFGEWRGKALVMNKFQNHFLVDENHFLMMKTTFFVMKTIF